MRVLFIGHDAQRHGAPRLLLHLLGWFKAAGAGDAEVLLRAGGPLLPEFKALAPTIVLPTQAGVRAWGPLLRLLYRKKFDVIFSNTIANGLLANELSRLGIPVVTNVHELDWAIALFGPRNLELVRRCTSLFIAGSSAVQQCLTERIGVSRERVRVVHEFIDMNGLEAEEVRPISDGPWLRHGVTGGVFVVGAVGKPEWRKGTDLFAQLAARVGQVAAGRNIHFVWIGGSTPELESDLARRGLLNITFIGATPRLRAYYRAFDVFALTSREDPFPLVCLEAAALGTPVLCFDRAGGMPEFVEEDAGFVVPYLDINAMAEKVMTLAHDHALRERMGAAARVKVMARHDVRVAAPEVMRLLREVTGVARVQA